MIPSIEHSGSGKIMEAVKRSGVGRVRDWIYVSQSKTILFNITMMDTCNYTFVKTIIYLYNLKNEPQYKL